MGYFINGVGMGQPLQCKLVFHLTAIRPIHEDYRVFMNMSE